MNIAYNTLKIKSSKIETEEERIELINSINTERRLSNKERQELLSIVNDLTESDLDSNTIENFKKSCSSSLYIKMKGNNPNFRFNTEEQFYLISLESKKYEASR